MRRKRRLRQRWPRWQVTASVLGILAVAAAAAVAVWPHAWWWLLLVAAALAAAVPPLLQLLRDLLARQRETSMLARTGLQETTGNDGRVLPTVAEADLQARVHRSVLDISYLARDIETDVRACLRDRRPVLVVGPSMVGKTRLTAHVVRQELASWPIVIPDSKDALASLDAADIQLRDTVIWLDDIERLLGSGGLTDGTLRRLVAAGNVVVATIRAAEFDRLRPTDQRRLPEWDVLAVFHRVFLRRQLSPAEEDQLDESVPDDAIRERIRQTGVGEYAGAGHQVADALALGASGASGAGGIGYAIVRGVADWIRCGLNRTVPADRLPQLAAAHMSRHDAARASDHDAWQAGLQWATREINPTVALIMPADNDTYDIYDYALDLLTNEDQPIPAAIWEQVLDDADLDELLGVALTADRYEERGVAIDASERLIDTAHSDEASAAAELAYLFFNSGDYDTALAWCERALRSEETQTGALAANIAGVALNRLGDTDGAIAAWEHAIETGHDDLVAAASYNLGNALLERGDHEGARTNLQRAANSEDPDTAPTAAVQLAVLCRTEGDLDGAVESLRFAFDTGNADHAPDAAAKLGVVELERGNRRSARDWYLSAIESGHREHAPLAMFAMGELYHLDTSGELGTDNLETAKTWYQRAIDSGHPDHAPGAMREIGNVLAGQGHSEEAHHWYQRAISTNHESHAPAAAVDLGVILASQGNVDDAQDAYLTAFASSHPTSAFRAANNLGALALERDDIDTARSWYERALDIDCPEDRSTVLLNLGNLLYDDGEPDDAEPLLREAAGSADPRVAVAATVTLASLANEAGDLDLAESAYRRVIERAASDQYWDVSFKLGCLYAERDAVAEAEAFLRPTIESGTASAASAALALAAVRERHGDRDGAEELYQIGLGSDRPVLNALAALLYRAFHESDPDRVQAILTPDPQEPATDTALDTGLLTADYLAEFRDQDLANLWYQWVIDSGHPHYAARAAIVLGDDLRRRNDGARARATYQRAIDVGETRLARKATRRLATVTHPNSAPPSDPQG